MANEDALMTTINGLLLGLGAYIGVGAVVGVVFLAFFVHRLDVAARGASIFFRPMIFLGCLALWPFVVLRILSGKTINEPIGGEE